MDIATLHQKFLNSNGLSTDTRSLKMNQLFFALQGSSFNGNLYALQAIENGASYAIVDDKSIHHKQIIHVDNVLKTLQNLANFHRLYLNIPIIALTGSNGKTTTKELIHSVLSTKFKCISTSGNLNNHIGVPLTLLKMDKSTEIGVVEMGANHLNEIDQLSEIAAPNYGYITNIGKAHLEGFGSEKNILIGKTELYRYLNKKSGTIFCNLEDQLLVKKLKDTETIYFSNTQNSTYKINFIEAKPFVKVIFDNTQINSNLIGDYNYTNIACSVAIGLHFNVPINAIKTAIESYTPQNNRSQLISTKTNQLVLDAYNANPTSMIAAIKNFESTATESNFNKVVILGDMFELGTYAKDEHQKIAKHLNDSNIETVLLAGNHFFESKIQSDKITYFLTTEELLDYLKNNPIENSGILIKGSRGMKLEQTIDFL